MLNIRSFPGDLWTQGPSCSQQIYTHEMSMIWSPTQDQKNDNTSQHAIVMGEISRASHLPEKL